MATHSSILAWRILWTEEPRGLQSVGSQELDMTEQLNLPTYLRLLDHLIHLLMSGPCKKLWPRNLVMFPRIHSTGHFDPVSTHPHPDS